MEVDKEYASSDLESGHEAGQKFLAIIDIWDFLRVQRHLLSVLVLIDHINCLICPVDLLVWEVGVFYHTS